MQTAQEIQVAVSQLSADELARFREWFSRFDAEIWDRQFEEDVKSGKLNRHGEKAIADFWGAKCKQL